MELYASELTRLTPTEFERLCRGVLDLLGCTYTQLTPRSADQGIDFFGELRIDSALATRRELPNFTTRMTVWMIGQAKHRSGVNSTPTIRELVGSIELAKASAYSGARPVVPKAIRACDPVYYLFFTTGSISTDGWTLLERSGAIGLDGPMLAAYLADCGVGVPTGTYSSRDFGDWLLKYA
jgi:hypothetical protein